MYALTAYSTKSCIITKLVTRGYAMGAGRSTGSEWISISERGGCRRSVSVDTARAAMAAVRSGLGGAASTVRGAVGHCAGGLRGTDVKEL